MKYPLLFSGVIFIVSANVSGQFLKKNSLSVDCNAGYSQQKINIGYSYSIGKFEIDEYLNRGNQVFLGFDIGPVQYHYAYGDVYSFSNYSRSKGLNLGFSISPIIIKPRKANTSKFKYSYVSFRVGFNKFNELDQRNYEFHAYSITIKDRQVKSTDFEFLFGKMLMLNSNNIIKIGCYFGLRSANYSYVKISQSDSKTITEKFDESLWPIIFGYSLSYQTNLGKK